MERIANPYEEQTAAKAVSLGLSSEETPISSVLQVALRVAEVVDGEREALTFPALLAAYYLIHFPHVAEEVASPAHRARAFKRLLWFMEEGSVQLSNMLREVEKIEDGVDTRRAVN